MEHQYVMHVWSDGSASAWNTRNNELYARLYGTLPQQSRECTREELLDLLGEQTLCGNVDNVAQILRQLRAGEDPELYAARSEVV